MLHTTQGIVLHGFKYSDTSLIVRILTRHMGLQSYLVPGIRKSKSRIKANIFQPFNLVDMVVYHKENSALQRIKEIRLTQNLPYLSADIRKTSLAIFLSEILLNAFKHQEPQPEAFEFIASSIIELDAAERNISLFHIRFLIQLSRFLGFAPGENYSDTNQFFNLREGIYQISPDIGGYSLEKDLSFYLYKISRNNPGDIEMIIIPQNIKKTLLPRLIDYYRLHMEGFREIKSHQILDAVFH